MTICEYILHTGKMRPCPAGEGCTVRATPKEVEATTQSQRKDVEEEMAGKMRAWDTERAKVLFMEGKSDLEIADMVGATEGAIRNWRAREGLRRARGGKRPRGEAAEETPKTPAKNACEGDTVRVDVPVDKSSETMVREAPSDELPLKGLKKVLLELELEGCEITLLAVSAQAARRGCAAVMTMLGPERG